MAESLLGKMQKTIDKQDKKITELQEFIKIRKEKYRDLQRKIKYLEKTVDKKVQSAVEKETIQLQKENEKLKEKIEKLEKLLSLDSNNSGIPTSKTPIGKEKRIPNLREKSNKKIGGQKGHKKHKLEKFNEKELTDSYYHEIEQCLCGGALEETGERTKDELELEVRVKKIRHYFKEYKCKCCGKKIQIPIPNELKEENQYGNNVKAIAVSLINEGCVSFNRTRKLIKGFSNDEIDISEGYLVKLQKKVSDKLEKFIQELKRKIINETVLYWDDTAISIDKKRACLRFYGTEKLALYTAHNQKNKEGLDKDDILNNLKNTTTVIHDHNTINYRDEYEFENAECCVHLLRDLKKIDESLNRKWCKELSELLIETNKRRKEFMNTGIYHFEDEFIEEVMERYDEIVNNGHEENKKDKNKYYDLDEKRLIKRLKKYKDNYLIWVIRFDIDFSNNLSERSLRGSKTKMKVSGQFKNVKNAEYYSRIKSYIETCKRNNINEHEAIVQLLNDKPLQISDILKAPNE